jgi:pyruvate dehydrogenase E2 component (dihydrolipoamide acetyltransferase)
MQIVVMPKLGLTMQEAELVRWLVEVGGEVRAGQPLCEIETDKITMEVESPAEGVLLRRVEAGSVIAVGVGIAAVGEPGASLEGIVLHGDRAAVVPDVAAQQLAAEVVPAAAADAPRVTGDGDGAGGRRPVAPVARRLAAELGIDLSTVSGTGPGGRILRRDVEAAAGRAPGDEDGGEV